MSWIDIGALDDVPERGARLVETPGGLRRGVPHRTETRSLPPPTAARTRADRCPKASCMAPG